MKSENIIIQKLEQLENKIDNVQKTKLWLNIKEVSEYIGLHPSTIRKYVQDGDIPHTRAGESNKLLFNRKKIDFWLLTGEKSPNKRQRKLMKDFIYEGK